jgi:hypothetical protein
MMRRASGAATPDIPASQQVGWSLATTAPTDAGSSRSHHNEPVGATGSLARTGGAWAWCRRHAVFIALLLGGVAWRALVLAAFRPALLVDESRAHLDNVSTWTPGFARPAGYGVLELTPVSWFTGSLVPVAVLQHMMGLAIGVVVYALLLRWGVARWLAALAAAPVLWNGDELASEHLILPDTLFLLAVVSALLVLCWRARPGMALALVGGLILGVATTVRPAGELVVLMAAVFMMLVGASWRRRLAGALVVVIGAAVPVLPYLAWHHHVHGEYTLAQTTAATDVRGDPWRFSSYLSPSTTPANVDLYRRHGGDQLAVARPLAHALATYQEHTYLLLPLLLCGLLLALIAVAGYGRARASGLRAACALTLAVPVAVLIGAAGSAEYSGHNQLLGIALWPAAGALGLTALFRGRRSPAADRPQIDDVDRASLTSFADAYGDVALAPVVIVIAAYNEAAVLPRVLTGIPSNVCGLPADIVVVDDGSTDGTAAAARTQQGVYAVTCPVNRGQGAAMRLGYRIARDHGARFIITTDADGQYDTADMPTVLAPLLDGSADFVTGSRRLGHHHSDNRFRRAGVYVFAWIVSALIGQKVTDTSFGLRAMRADLTAAVTLNQPQYQSSELLIGVRAHGYRIAEVPATMHLRGAGTTKKGGNLVYGMRYARVVFGTWWREGCPAPVAGRAPALARVRPDPFPPGITLH